VLQLVNVGHKSLADYATIATRGLMDEIRELAAPLAGARVLELSATARTMGLPEGTIKARLSRARDLLKKRFPHLKRLNTESELATIKSGKEA